MERVEIKWEKLISCYKELFSLEAPSIYYDPKRNIFTTNKGISNLCLDFPLSVKKKIIDNYSKILPSKKDKRIIRQILNNSKHPMEDSFYYLNKTNLNWYFYLQPFLEREVECLALKWCLDHQIKIIK
ncbi:MAG TPA: hypothetical protein IAB56_02045 [Candidatus Scybalousia intestinigallinarum]|nr:hypothetical protein [Candidatus Scybalousia intestinigallinarum]